MALAEVRANDRETLSDEIAMPSSAWRIALRSCAAKAELVSPPITVAGV
jgi:hypothetical protein